MHTPAHLSVQAALQYALIVAHGPSPKGHGTAGMTQRTAHILQPGNQGSKQQGGHRAEVRKHKRLHACMYMRM